MQKKDLLVLRAVGNRVCEQGVGVAGGRVRHQVDPLARVELDQLDELGRHLALPRTDATTVCNNQEEP